LFAVMTTSLSWVVVLFVGTEVCAKAVLVREMNRSEENDFMKKGRGKNGRRWSQGVRMGVSRLFVRQLG